MARLLASVQLGGEGSPESRRFGARDSCVDHPVGAIELAFLYEDDRQKTLP
jgi:hypothetical protein